MAPSGWAAAPTNLARGRHTGTTRGMSHGSFSVAGPSGAGIHRAVADLPVVGRLEDDLVVGRHVAGAASGSVPLLPRRTGRGELRLVRRLRGGVLLGDHLDAGANGAG